MRNFKKNIREIKIEKHNSHHHHIMQVAATNKRERMLSIMLMISRQVLTMDLISSQLMLKAVLVVPAVYSQNHLKKQAVLNKKRRMILISTLATSNRFIRPQLQNLDNHSHKINHLNKLIATLEEVIFSIYQEPGTTVTCHHNLRQMEVKTLWISLMTQILEHHKCKQIITLQIST